MGNISTVYTNVFTQCIRKRQQNAQVNQQLIDIDSDCDIDNEEIIYDKHGFRNLK